MEKKEIQEQIDANQLAGMSLEEAIYQAGYAHGVEYQIKKKEAQGLGLIREKKELPLEVVIPADKVVFMKESITKLRALNHSDYKDGEFGSYNYKNEGRYKAFEEVLQWANPLKFYEEEKSIIMDEMTILSKELQEKDAKLHQAEEKIKELERWKSEANAILNPIWKYTDTLKVPLGASKTDAVITYAKRAKDLLSEVLLGRFGATLEFHNNECYNNIKTFLYGE